MDREIKKSGMNLVLAGVLGVLFFWLTDPVYGLARRSAGENVIDAMNEASLGTLAGITGSAAVLLIGVWIMTRRST
jgi:hypothetical protein